MALGAADMEERAQSLSHLPDLLRKVESFPPPTYWPSMEEAKERACTWPSPDEEMGGLVSPPSDLPKEIAPEFKAGFLELLNWLCDVYNPVQESEYTLHFYGPWAARKVRFQELRDRVRLIPLKGGPYEPEE